MDSAPRKRPDSVYSRKPAKGVERPPMGAINDENFAFKVLEVLRPVTFDSSLATPNALGAATSLIASDSDNENENEHHNENDADKLKRHCVKNVHELLESGLSNRLYDEIDYLVSGLETLKPHNAQKKTVIALHGYICDLGDKLFESFSPMQASRLRSSGILERMFVALSPFLDNQYVQRFIVTCLVLLCSDVRRLDHFISIPDGFGLALALIKNGNVVLPAGIQSVKLEKIFQKPMIPRVLPIAGFLFDKIGLYG